MWIMATTLFAFQVGTGVIVMFEVTKRPRGKKR